MRRGLWIAALLVAGACGSGGRAPAPPGNHVGEGCAAKAECQAGLVCASGTCVASLPAAPSCPSAPGMATIAAADVSIAPPEPPPDMCVSTVVGSVLPPEMVQDLGTQQVGTDVSFRVAEGTSSFVIFSQEVPDTAPDAVLVGSIAVPNSVVPTNVRDPAGTLYYDDLADWPAIEVNGTRYPEVSGLLAFDPGFQSVSAGFLVPNTSAALDRTVSTGRVTPGTWTFTVNDWARQCPFGPSCADGDTSGQYRVFALTHPGPLASTGALDLEVYLATDSTSVLSSAAAAVADPRTARWVQSIAHYLANAGICLGAVTFHDVPEWARERYAPNGTVDLTDLDRAGPCSHLNQLFTTAIVPRRSVHLFVADDLVEDSNQTSTHVVGVDGSIPGPSGFPGTVYGGAIVGLFGEFGRESSAGACSGSKPDLAGCGTDFLAYVAAHEIGHWLGLFHTTEAPGNFFDPVSDTARCPCSACGTSCGTSAARMTNARCTVSDTCGGGENLMFWLFDERRSTGVLSRDQGQIMRLNPAVR